MPTSIAVTSADLVLPATDHHTPTAALLQHPDDQTLEAAVADMQVLVEQSGYVIALYPASLPAAHRRRIHAVRSLLESDRIAVLPSPLPPLALSLLVRQLRQLSLCDVGPGVLASAARLLSHYLHAGALLGSVAHLDRVPVGLKAHARSWVPGSRFAVAAHPRAQLVKAGAGELEGPEYATRLLFARGQLAADWVTDHLAAAWRVQDVQEAPLPAASPGWWGTGRLVEFAAHLPDLGVVHQLVASVRREVCRWCGLELIGDHCGFCAAPIGPREPRDRAPLPLRQGIPSSLGP
ncbi:hypothetical protein ABZ705_03285 [Streptomyces sp. NPDC006984]|uniref:hypothetical protein n=1 Tax=unclassified Streptomyces TaxID=2593676 RepID=UPI003409A3CD